MITLTVHVTPFTRNSTAAGLPLGYYYLCTGYGADALYFREGCSDLRNCSPSWYKTINEALTAAQNAGYKVELGQV